MYLLRVWLHHDIAVDEDGADDGEREEGVGEHMDGDPGSPEVRTDRLQYTIMGQGLPSNRVKG